MFNETMMPIINGTDPDRSCLPLSTNEKVLKSNKKVITTSAPKACVAVTFGPGAMTPKLPCWRFSGVKARSKPHPAIAPTVCDVMYRKQRTSPIWPVSRNPRLMAGFTWPPLTVFKVVMIAAIKNPASKAMWTLDTGGLPSGASPAPTAIKHSKPVPRNSAKHARQRSRDLTSFTSLWNKCSRIDCFAITKFTKWYWFQKRETYIQIHL